MYHQPTELLELTEGEKLLIQQVSPYVPLQHLQNGSYGSKGHVCAFPQDVHEMCTKLPRLPSDVQTVSIVKSYTSEDGEAQKISFQVRKQRVISALKWLKKYNCEYRSIEIVEENLSWMKSDAENLPGKVTTEIQSDNNTDHIQERKQNEIYESQSPTDAYLYGYLNPPHSQHLPQPKDADVTEGIRESYQKVNRNTSIDFPYVSEVPVSEYDTTIKLFCKAFPWLYPGGRGDFNDYSEFDEDIDTWMERLLYYFDARFARDKMWCLFALNYAMRRKNAIAGSYFVKSFLEDPPKSLSELQEKIENDNIDWINRIQYYSYKVRGSAGYWRFKRSKVYTWINHHVSVGNGPPSLFITLSCAEYYWPNIRRLLKERTAFSGSHSNFSSRSSFTQEVNDMTIVVQEYFQRRVSIWLQTIGRYIFGIQHHWLRYEFAPGRGQIHAHMLAITNHHDVHNHYYNLQKFNDAGQQQAEFLADWVDRTFAMTAMVLPEMMEAVEQLNKQQQQQVHPSNHFFSDVTDHQQDITRCQWFLQRHQCSEKCLQQRRRM